MKYLAEEIMSPSKDDGVMVFYMTDVSKGYTGWQSSYITVSKNLVD